MEVMRSSVLTVGDVRQPEMRLDDSRNWIAGAGGDAAVGGALGNISSTNRTDGGIWKGETKSVEV